MTKIYGQNLKDWDKNFDIWAFDQTLDVMLVQPARTINQGNEPENINRCRYVKVNQSSIRASDGIRLHYDYERDGWVIEQRPIYQEENGNVAGWLPDEPYQEVAFIRSWALSKTLPEKKG